MVSFSLSRTLVFTILVSVLMAGILSVHLCCVNHERDGKHSDFHASREYAAVGSGEMTKLMQLADSAVSLYKNAQVEELRMNLSDLFEKCVHVPPTQYSDVIAPIVHALNKSFLTCGLNSFEKVGNWETLIFLNRTMVEALCESEIRRHCFSEVVMTIESLYLKRLHEIQKLLHARRGKIVLSVQEEIERWIERIDSPSGMMRNYILWNLAATLELVKDGLTTRDKVVTGCRMAVKPLSALLGRDPKWIDEIK